MCRGGKKKSVCVCPVYKRLYGRQVHEKKKQSWGENVIKIKPVKSCWPESAVCQPQVPCDKLIKLYIYIHVDVSQELVIIPPY